MAGWEALFITPSNMCCTAANARVMGRDRLRPHPEVLFYLCCFCSAVNAVLFAASENVALTAGYDQVRSGGAGFASAIQTDGDLRQQCILTRDTSVFGRRL